MRTLDTRDARPLTDREMVKVLSAIIGGIVEMDRPDIALNAMYTTLVDIDINLHNLPREARYLAPDAVASVVGAVAGFRSWCNAKDVDNAVAWFIEHYWEVVAEIRVSLKSRPV